MSASPLTAARAAPTDLAARLAAWPEGATSPLVPDCGAALASMIERFDLDDLEAALLRLAAAHRLDPDGRTALAAAGHTAPTLEVAAGLAAVGHARALAADRPLRRWELVVFAEPAPGPLTPCRLGEPAVRHLVGDDSAEPALEALIRPAPARAARAGDHAALAGAIGRALASHGLVLLTGGAAADRVAVAAAGARAGDLAPLVLDGDALPAEPGGLAAVARAIERALLLAGRLAVLDVADTAAPAVTRLLETLRAPAICAAAAAPAGLRRDAAPLAMPTLDFPARRELWRVSAASSDLDATALDRLAWQFPLAGDEIATLAARHAAAGEAALWAAARAAVRPPAGATPARRVEPRARLADLVVPDGAARQLAALVEQGRRQARVHHDWGFASRHARGLGVTALFAGPSGTGKTFAAEAIAGELGLDLLRVELSQLVSKYIGETEKNLDAVFADAERGGAVLLFDEADALFGKRSEVKDSHDRYANIEVSYLLQRMEAYRGVAVLTTNLKAALDDAFLRRLRFVVHFPFPDPPLRAELWRRAFPDAAPTEGLDPARLARLHLTGANIDTVAMNAAFLAASDGTAVTMRHVEAAAEGEYAKLERAVSAKRTLEEGR